MSITHDWILTVGRAGAAIHSDKSGTIATIPDEDVNWREHAELLVSAPRLQEDNTRLQKQVKLLREALGELLDPPQGTDIRDRITKGRFALEATKEGA